MRQTDSDTRPVEESSLNQPDAGICNSRSQGQHQFVWNRGELSHLLTAPHI